MMFVYQKWVVDLCLFRGGWMICLFRRGWMICVCLEVGGWFCLSIMSIPLILEYLHQFMFLQKWADDFIG